MAARAGAGRKQLPPEQADRVREGMRKLLSERFDNNNTRLAEALRIAQPAVSRLISRPPKDSPSLATALAVAELLGIDEYTLRYGAPPLNMSNLEIAIAYWSKRWPDSVIRRAREREADGEQHSPPEWSALMDELKSQKH